MFLTLFFTLLRYERVLLSRVFLFGSTYSIAAPLIAAIGETESASAAFLFVVKNTEFGAVVLFLVFSLIFDCNDSATFLAVSKQVLPLMIVGLYFFRADVTLLLRALPVLRIMTFFAFRRSSSALV